MKKWLAAIVMGSVAPLTAFAQAGSDYPNRPIRIVVPYAPGGASDVLTRQIADRLSKRLNQSVVVDNKAGGNTIIASEEVARAPADGYTLYSTNTSIIQTPLLYTARYDEEKDFVPVTQYCTTPLTLAVKADLPVNSLDELLAYIRSRPGQTSYGSAGAGGTQHILSEALKQAAGIDSVHVPYKGETPLLTDFLGGRLDWYIATPITIMPHVRSGKVRLLAATGEDRIPLLPDLPTFKELGVPGLDVVGWYGMFAPAATPPEVVGRISKEISDIVRSPELAQYIEENGLIVSGADNAAFAEQLPYFRTTYRTLIKENDIKVN